AAGDDRAAVPELALVDEDRPLYFRRGGGVAMGFTLPSEPADFLAAYVLENRLRNRLRHETSTTYSVRSHLVRLGLAVGHLSIHAAGAPKQGRLAIDETERVFDELIANGHDTGELAAFLAMRDQAALHDDAALGPLDSAAQRVLFGGKPTVIKTWEAKIRR